MTVLELKQILDKFDDNATVAYLHNQYGVIHIDDTFIIDNKNLSGDPVHIVVMQGKCDEGSEE